MHGRKREDESVTQTDEEKRIRMEKIAKYNAAKSQLLQMRGAHQYDATAYALTAKLIEINPDFYTLFNYRKEIVQDMVKQDPGSLPSLSRAEMDLSFKALLKNPKSYGAWHHRIWVMDLGAIDLKAELQLCSQMLGMDARNFHCWNYRRAVVARAHTPPEEEFKYTTEKINENFSNYSAWHYRTVLIPRIYTAAWMQSGDDPEARRKEYDAFLDQEFELVKQAFYTEPEDQSAWLYHRWLLGRVVATGATNQLPVLGVSLGTHLFEDTQLDSTTKQLEASSSSSSSSSTPSLAGPTAAASLARHLLVFTRESHALDELLTIEPNCKWALLTSAILQAGMIACQQQQEQQRTKDAATSTSPSSVAELTTNIQHIFTRLIELDPMRTNYYKEVRQRFLQ